MATAANQETLAKINAALSVFATSTDKQQIAGANEWLQDFQHTIEAWEISSSLLINPDCSDAVKTFAAQTLKTKVVYDLAQLPAEQHALLRDTLVSALQHYSAGPRKILIQVCLALSALSIQMPDWSSTAVKDLIASLGADPAFVPGLLQFLAVLPDDLTSNSRIPISDDEYRTRTQALLTDNGERVIEILTVYQNAQGITPHIQNLIFEVLSNWVMAGEISTTTLANTTLFDFAFQALASDELFDNAAELLCELIHETQELDDNMAVIEMIVPRLISLQPRIAVDKDDPDKLRRWCQIFCEAGETYRMLIVHHTETFLPLVLAIAECAANDDLDIVQLTFSFWYRLGQSLGKQRSIPPEITKVYENVLNTFLRHIHFPSDVESTTAQDADDFRSFRHDIGDVLKDCCYVLGADFVLDRTYAVLTSALERGMAGNVVAWQEVEAPLFAMRALGGEIDWTQQNEKILKIMEILPALPAHPRVRYAATMLMSRYTPWVAKHPEHIPSQLNYITAAFQDTDLEVVSAAGHALKYLCQDCKQSLVPYLEQLYQFLATVGVKLMQEDKLAIYEAIGWIISSMPMEHAASTLRKFAIDIFATIQAVPGDSSVHNQAVIECLEQLEQLLDVVGPFGEELPAACQNTAAETWAIMDDIIARRGAIPDICDRTTRVIRLGLQVFDKQALPLVPAILARLTSRFENTGFASYLWAIGKVIQRFGLEEDPVVRNAIQQTYEMCTVKCSVIFSETTISHHSDVVDDYLSIVTPLTEQCPDILFLSPVFPTAFVILVGSLQLYNSDTTFRALGLIRAIIGHDCLQLAPGFQPPPKFPLYAEAISATIQKHGPLLVSNLFAGLLDQFAPEMMSGVITTVRIMTQLWTTSMQQWVPTVVDALRVPPALEPAKAQFLLDFNSALASQDLDKLKPALANLQRSVLRAKDRRRPLDR
ncbi:mRNA transport regulator MTR10 [Serendipita indica DSM 11827]|nr:mRNA transport regulator MTR10 [Serendipita indica DSM 11827]